MIFKGYEHSNIYVQLLHLIDFHQIPSLKQFFYQLLWTINLKITFIVSRDP